MKTLLLITTNTNKFERGGLPITESSIIFLDKHTKSLVKKGFLKIGEYVISDDGLAGRSYGNNYIPTPKAKEYLNKISQI